MMRAPLRPGTRPVDAAQLAVEDTSTDGPEFAATPGVTARGPKIAAFSNGDVLEELTIPAGMSSQESASTRSITLSVRRSLRLAGWSVASKLSTTYLLTCVS